MTKIILAFALVTLAGCSHMLPTAPTNGQIALTAVDTDMAVNGQTAVTATVTDRGTPVDGVSVHLVSSLGTIVPSDAMTSGGGLVRATFTATRIGVGSIIATSGSVASGQLQVRVGDFAVDRVTLRTEGAPPTVGVVASAQDASGSPIANITVRFSLDGQGTMSATSATTNGNGEARITITSASAATRVGASVGSKLANIALGQIAPTVFLSCNGAVAGVAAFCSVSSGSTVQNVFINWGDGTPEQAIGLAPTAAHVFARADRYTVGVRALDGAGQVATANATATITAPPAPPPVVTPQPFVTSVVMSQEANATAGCAAFNVSAGPATGTTISSIVVTGTPLATPVTFNTTSGRFATCGLTANVSILTATATDSSGGTAAYPLIVK